MSKNKKQKAQLIEEYVAKLEKAKAVYIVEPMKLTANQSVQLKKELYDLNSSFNVVKNSLFKLALEKVGYELPENIDTNAQAAIFSSDQISETAKVIKTFAASNKEAPLVIKSGLIDGKAVKAEQVKVLADLPSRDVLLAQVLGTMNAPISGFVTVLAGNVRGIVNVVNAIKDQKAEAGA